MNSQEKEPSLDDETSRSIEESSSCMEICSERDTDSSLTFDSADKLTLDKKDQPDTVSNQDVELDGSKQITVLPKSQQIESSDTDEMKRTATKQLIERYFYQLLEGCGNPKCNNKYCASSGEIKNLTPNQAAARAIQLYSQDAKLCESQPPKFAKTKDATDGDTNGATSTLNLRKNIISSADNITSSKHNKKDCGSRDRKCSRDFTGMNSVIDEDLVTELINKNDVVELKRLIDKYLQDYHHIARGFIRKPSTHIDQLLERVPDDLKTLKKEDLRSLESDPDKDEDSCVTDAAHEEPLFAHSLNIDLISLRRTIQKIHRYWTDSSHGFIYTTFSQEFNLMAQSIQCDNPFDKSCFEDMVTATIVFFEIMALESSEFMDFALPAICVMFNSLGLEFQVRIANIWSKHCTDSLKKILEMLQQLISLQVVTSACEVQDNTIIVNATMVMKVLYYANIMAGVVEPAKLQEKEPEPSSDEALIQEVESLIFSPPTSSRGSKANQLTDQLATELNISVLDSRIPLIPFEDFYNEPLSDTIEMDADYLNYKTDEGKAANQFSFMLYSFILTPATKSLGLYYDSRIRMFSERRISFIRTHVGGQVMTPYLKLRVRRDHIIDDALVELEVIAIENPKDLKKQLVVEFDGEQGIDEGGVSKEFFQLIVEQIFNPDYAMFIHQENNDFVWFNSTSFENEAQFKLIGIVLGLAIYNNIILAVNFPMVVYRKLMGMKGTFLDLKDWNPVLYNSLNSMLNYTEPNMEEIFMQTFRISYSDVFGNVLYHDLKLNGDSIFVNQDNKQEFVDLYADFLLNKSVEKQFNAFLRGFQMVTDESPLSLLFRPEELDLLVCGSRNFDFNELEKSTEYEGGYTEESEIIVNFWKIVHALPMESKCKLLEFTTGSDRVPIGGLCRLKLIIARNGPDCDRLPTSHTCFNVLLLPEYSTKEKLEDRLLKAINYSKGFGML